jgi:hypothetical protein
MSSAVQKHDLARWDVDHRDLDAELHLDALLAIILRRAQRVGLCRRRAG